MRQPNTGVTPEGWPLIGLCALATLTFAVLDCWFMALVLLIFTGFVLHFFRDPERVVPQEPGAVASPADGKVVKVGRAKDPVSGKDRTAICVFMNVFNVHVNRAPVAGTVKSLTYHPGRFFNASLDKASEENERLVMDLAGANNRRFTVVQIAGLIARRIVCRVEPGDKLRLGERFGMIRFGSRLDVYLPDGFVPAVSVGDVVKAGESVIALDQKAKGHTT